MVVGQGIDALHPLDAFQAVSQFLDELEGTGIEKPLRVGDGGDNRFIIAEMPLELVERGHQRVILRQPNSDAEIYRQPSDARGEGQDQRAREQ